MRQSRIDSKTRVIAKALLANERGAVETCWLLASRRDLDSTLLSDDDWKFITAVVSETDDLPVGEFRSNWHPDFVRPKLDQLAKYEATVVAETMAICGRILQVNELRRLEKKTP